ncbi:MAG: hypothetical protein V1799_08710 [bacterium]
MDTQKKSSLKYEYDALIERTQEQFPGIFDLLEIYQANLSSLQQSQEYLQLFHQTFISSTSNSSQ